MKLSGNESLYIVLITKWYVTEIFSAGLPPAEAPKVGIMVSQRKYFV